MDANGATTLLPSSSTIQALSGVDRVRTELARDEPFEQLIDRFCEVLVGVQVGRDDD